MSLLLIALLFVYGLIAGSFVNAWVWRLRQQLDDDGNPKKLSAKQRKAVSITHGRSMCPHCKHALAAKDLVPVFSWLLLHGKCRYCNAPIAAQYPIIELLMAILFMLSYVLWPNQLLGAEWCLLVGWLFTLVPLLALGLYDAKWFILPSGVIYIAISIYTAGLAVYTLVGGDTTVFVQAATAALLYFGLFIGIYATSAIARRKGWSSQDWLGFGDVRLAVLLGLIAGTPLNVLVALFVASLAGLVFALPAMLHKKLGMGSQIPFGPFLLFGAAFALFFGSSITNWYTTVMLGM